MQEDTGAVRLGGKDEVGDDVDLAVRTGPASREKLRTKEVSLRGKFQDSGNSRSAKWSVCLRNPSWAHVGIRSGTYVVS